MLSVSTLSNDLSGISTSASFLASDVPPEGDDPLSAFFGASGHRPVVAKQRLLLEGLLSTDHSLAHPKAVASRMLHAYGTLPKVLSAPPEDIASLQGVSRKHADLVKSAYDALVGCLYDQARERPLLDHDALIVLAQYVIGQSATEKVQMFFLNSRHRLFGSEILCSGSESFVSVSVRTVIAAACRKNASSFVIAHNHPRGSTAPSRHDLDFTESLLSVTTKMGIGLIDSLIVSADECYSFRKAGQL
jgi:DNA repair protein RadC